MSTTLRDITITVTGINKSDGTGPAKVYVDCANPEVSKINVWKFSEKVWNIGNVLELTIYLKESKEYGAEWHVSQFPKDDQGNPVIKVLKSAINPLEPESSPSDHKTQENRVPTALEPLAANVAPVAGQQSASKKEKLITILALAKPVIQSGGSEDDLRRWLKIIENMVNE